MYSHALEILQVWFQNITIKQHHNKSSCSLFCWWRVLPPSAVDSRAGHLTHKPLLKCYPWQSPTLNTVFPRPYLISSCFPPWWLNSTSRQVWTIFIGPMMESEKSDNVTVEQAENGPILFNEPWVAFQRLHNKTTSHPTKSGTEERTFTFSHTWDQNLTLPPTIS